MMTEETRVFALAHADEDVHRLLLQAGQYPGVDMAEAVTQIEGRRTARVKLPSWADNERDLSAWTDNNMQKDAFLALYDCLPEVRCLNDPGINADWERLQSSDHFYYMSTKYASDGDVHKYFSPYKSPYEAYTNYMNILADFRIRVRSMLGR